MLHLCRWAILCLPVWGLPPLPGIAHSCRPAAASQLHPSQSAVMGSFLTCGQCQKGYALVGDRYRQECVALVDIRCDEWDGTHCRRCQEVPEVVKISFTLGPTYCEWAASRSRMCP